MHSAALLLPPYCLQREWCDLCSILSAIRGLQSCKHTGQSEINVLSLGNTQEMVSFIVLSPADNCFATVPQMRKLWVWEKVWAPVHAHARVCVSTIYCNIFSNNNCVNSFSVASLRLSLFLLNAFRKLSTLNEIWRKPMLKFCSSHRLWCFEDWFCCFCLHTHCSVPKYRLTVIPIKLLWKTLIYFAS